MIRAQRSARLAIGGCATAALLTTALLAAPAHAEPVASCATHGGFFMIQEPDPFPPGLFAELDLNGDGFVCVKPVPPGFIFIDNRVRS